MAVYFKVGVLQHFLRKLYEHKAELLRHSYLVAVTSHENGKITA